MRLIDADAYIHEYRDWLDSAFGEEAHDEIIESIEEFPSVDTWILCSERMPENDTLVLISSADKEIHIAYIDTKEYWRVIGSYNGSSIIAWMPLPEPYAALRRERKACEKIDREDPDDEDAGEWIPTSKRIPVNDTDVLIATPDGAINIAFIDSEGDWILYHDIEYDINVIAWMPLPKPFKEEKIMNQNCDVTKQMHITGMKEFLKTCETKYVDTYNQLHEDKITKDDVFTVWCCKTLQNYTCLISDKVPHDGAYCEYTFNGDKQELYEDFYKKVRNTCYTS